ncbi:hypothetical protein I316_03018 [Kwoniella heveanensis BCC8398]|uniref:Zn(2)-C6 fungal-type domain-containing protein n=1 Tax=Kwoniella heveanensis BCC8398 TaxID=1296120 RepID=A0A1B9GWQ6_9TREE|nr:hypothetical protein I316_03018 [Kwoniella heveanensis BCC8398]
MPGYSNHTIAHEDSIRDSPAPIDGLKIDPNVESMEESEKKRKRLSLQAQPAASGSSHKGKQRAATMGGAIRTSPEQDDLEEVSRKAKAKSSGLAGFTSCEACRRGKRRCEPSPLVPPDHPDAARLPCARCRRFAIECVRVRAVRRKGPAPVDLSAVSDAAHGYSGSAGPSSRRVSSVSEVGFDSERGINTSAFNSPGPPAVSPGWEGIEEAVSGPVIDNVLGLFFDYVYPLTPCLHRPTFVSDLAARRDRSDPTFCALALTVIASTLVQVPRALIYLDKDEVERLARRCIAVAREKMAHIWEDPSPISSTMKRASSICFWGTIQPMSSLRHKPIKWRWRCVLTRKQSDRERDATQDLLGESGSHNFVETTALTDQPAAAVSSRQEYGVPKVDDDMITSDGISPQPEDRPSLIVGFNIVTVLFQILNDAMLIQRRKSSRTMDEIIGDLQRVQDLRERTLHTSLRVPDHLKLRNAFDSRSASPAFDWETKLRDRFIDYFRSAADGAHALNSFLVMQGNILVTQQVVRLVLLQTRQALLAQLAMYTPIMPALELQDEQAEDIACELLDGLNSLPVECVATNGPSLVQKGATKSQKLLMQFLSVLSVIEGMYSFGKDISAE